MGQATVNPENIKAKLQTPSISSKQTDAPELTNAPGYRAAEAYIRPSPLHTLGTLLEHGFDLRNSIFKLRLDAHKSSTEHTPTEVYLPGVHFPKDKCDVQVTGGKWSISVDDEHGGLVQRLRWWHAEGEQELKVTGVPISMVLGMEDEDGYLEQCQQNRCALM